MLNSFEASKKLNKVYVDAILNFNDDINISLAAVRDSLIKANESAYQRVLFISSIDIIIGLIFVTFIVVGLIKVLNRISKFSETISNGDFSYDPQVTERGEIGVMVEGLKKIPQTLTTTMSQCIIVAEDIRLGKFRTRLDVQSLDGGFKKLGDSINSICELYTEVIDLLPISIISLNADEKIIFLNTFGKNIRR